MSSRNLQQSEPSITAQYTQYQLSSNSERAHFSRRAQIEPANSNEQTKPSGHMASGAVSIPRRKSPLSISYTLNDEDDSNTTNKTDLSTELDDQSSTNIVGCVDTNHLKTPLDITSTSSSHMQSCSYHSNDTHVAAGQSPDISTNINSPDKNNKDNSNNNSAVTHTPFDNTACSYENSQYKSETSLICQTQVTKNTSLLKNEQRRSGSNRLSWIQHIDKRQPTWIRGFFDKHQRVNDEVAASSKSLHLPSKSTSPTTAKPFSGRLSLPQLTSYISSKLSVPYLKATDNNSKKHQSSKRRYAKNKRKGRKTANHHHTQQPKQTYVTPKSTDDTPVHGGQRRRQPLLESDVYRMSHIKLTNPRRSLREQVVIINSMFWYLSTLPTKHQQHHQQQQQWRLLYNITASPTNSPSSALKNTHSRLPSLSHSILPQLKHTLTTSSTTP